MRALVMQGYCACFVGRRRDYFSAFSSVTLQGGKQQIPGDAGAGDKKRDGTKPVLRLQNQAAG